MDLFEYSTKNPVTVIVGCILLCMFGLLALFKLPVQLIPNVDVPVVTVTTTWEGASPQEIEREIVEKQEEELKSLRGLKKMTSESRQNEGIVRLEFYLDVDMTRALLDTSDKLRQVKDYPENVNQPVVASASTEQAKAIAWFVLKSKTPRENIGELKDLMEDIVKPQMERVPGVGSVNVYGGMEREVQVKIDIFKLAARKLTMQEVRDALNGHNINVSAGDIEQGKRSYIIRTVGQYESLDEIKNTIIKREADNIVRVSDVAEVDFGYKESKFVVRTQGEPAIVMNAIRESGSNVIKVMQGLKDALEKVNQDILQPKDLQLVQVYDETDYINDAIKMVTDNLWLGGLLTTLVLFFVLRNVASTLIIAASIPLSVIGSFLVMAAFDRNINVISLAGVAFSVGMVVDNSVVVLENIFRHLQMGKDRYRATLDGTREVWGAVVASTLTTMVVFIPVIFVQEEVGQLFRDISIAITASIGLSIIVAIVFVPMTCSRLLNRESMPPEEGDPRNMFERMEFLSKKFFGNLISWINKKTARKITVVTGITAASFLLSIWLLPPLTYLPTGNQNLVIGFLIPPPGYSTEEFKKMGKHIEKTLRPYWEAKLGSKEAAKLDAPPIDNFFYVAFGQGVFMGLKSQDHDRIKELEPIVNKATSDIPGVFAFAQQTSLFERGLSGGNSIDLEISGDDIDEIKGAGMTLMPQLAQTLSFPRPDPPNFMLGGTELQIRLDEDKASEVGLTVADAGFIVRTVVDGSIIGDYWDKENRIDLKLSNSIAANGSSDGHKRFEQLEKMPVVISDGKLVPLNSFAEFSEIESPNQINHIEKRRAVKLIVTPPDGMELEKAMDILKNLVTDLREKKIIPSNIETSLAGTADKLTAAREAIQGDFWLAIAITYLLLAALMESFFYPLIIMFAVPLGAVGGIAGLSLVNKLFGQQLDTVTLLGFIILVGTVVNNAILIVHQTLNHIRLEGMEPDAAINESVKNRMRPIFMTTFTTIFGMLPLVFFPGAGSELYRGLGAVMVGGMLASTVFILILIPALLSLAFSVQYRMGKRSLN